MFRYIRTVIKAHRSNMTVPHQAQPFLQTAHRDRLYPWGQRLSASRLSTTQIRHQKPEIDKVAQYLMDSRWLAKSYDRNLSLKVGWSPEQTTTIRQAKDLANQRLVKLDSQLRAEGWDMEKIEEIVWSKSHPWASSFFRGVGRALGRGWGGR